MSSVVTDLSTGTELTEDGFFHPTLEIFANISNITFHNYTDFPFQDDYIFDRLDVRIIFITLYSIVFSCCFLGNLLVILVVTLSRRLRSITNFFLANLAVADLCVGIFCVYQNLTMYLIPTWVLGDFLCKMYQFVHSLSYTASIFILIVICTERYFAIIHPITCKQILTPTRLRLVIGAVWVTSAMYSAPRFLWVQTIVNPMRDGGSETICATHRQRYNSKLFDMINFVFLYVIPLAIMTVLYTRIAVRLCQSSRELEKHLNASISTMQQKPSIQYYHHTCSHACQHIPAKQKEQVPFYSSKFKQQPLNTKFTLECRPRTMTGGAIALHYPNSTQNVLRARRGVIRMLIVMVLTFALCNLPFHARKMWQYWSSGYRGSSDFSTLFTPITFLITYINSGVNPLLYAFLSRNFRRGMREILMCSLRGSSSRRPPSHKFYNGTPQAKEDEFVDNLLKKQDSTYKAQSTSVTIVHQPMSDSYSNEV